MFNLIKSELYASLKSGITPILLIIVSLVLTFFPFILGDVTFNSNLDLYIQTILESGLIGILIFATIISIIIGIRYDNRTFYYEIMNGYSTHQIIISKIISYLILFIVIYLLPKIIILLILGNNGLGTLPNIYEPILYFSIITMHLTLTAVLISMIVKIPAVSALIIYMGSMFITLIYSFLMENGQTESIFEYNPIVQLMKINQTTYSSTFISNMVIGLLLNIGVLYTVTYLTYKHKKFK